MFKVINKDTKSDANGVVLVSLLLNVNIFLTFDLVFVLLTLNM